MMDEKVRDHFCPSNIFYYFANLMNMSFLFLITFKSFSNLQLRVTVLPQYNVAQWHKRNSWIGARKFQINPTPVSISLGEIRSLSVKMGVLTNRDLS